MKHCSPLLAACLTASLFAAAPAQAQVQDNDIMSILARQAETPPRPAPTTVPYSYTMTLDMTSTEGDKVSEGQAVLRIDPTQPAGSRAQIISSSNPENEPLIEFLKEVEDPEKDMAESAEGFWCGPSKNDAAFTPTDFEVISETDTEATLKPKPGALAALLMQSEESDDPGKQERKMKKKLLDRVDGQMTLTKPNADMKGFRVTMTRPMTMMVVAKLKVMDVEQNCALAPNGFYHLSRMNMNVEGKALGKAFGQKLDIRITPNFRTTKYKITAFCPS